jgi:hypothetical protein
MVVQGQQLPDPTIHQIDWLAMAINHGTKCTDEMYIITVEQPTSKYEW